MNRVPTAVVAPEINPNDQEIWIVSWAIEPGVKVTKGQIICQLETTKAIFDLPAEIEGYLYPSCAPGHAVSVGSTIAWLLPEPNPALIPAQSAQAEQDASAKLISHQAKALMQKHGLSEADFPSLTQIRSTDIEKYLSQDKSIGQTAAPDLNTLKIADNSLLIYGTGNHSLVVWDTIQRGSSYVACAFVDYSPRFNQYCQLPVFPDSTLAALYERGLRLMHICLPDAEQELAVADKARKVGFKLVNVIDPTAVISQTASLGNNIFLGAQTIVGPLSQIGDFSRLLNGASVAHHAKLGNCVRITDGARIAGTVTIGDRTLIGLGVTVNYYLTIGKDVVVVSGASVFNNVLDAHVVRSDGNSYPKH
ncbi:MAG: hypothetical protein K2X29_09530 [Candidatus Obscuribacterales bacterium]|nr:hypothetical protein [Candidatus Obscuribacterales bacterium]